MTVKSFFFKYLHDKSGTTAVEFGLTAIFFLILMVGVMEAGRVAWTINGLRYAVEETARYASLNSDLTSQSFQTYAADQLSELLISSDNMTITTTMLTSSGVDFVEIDGTYQHTTMLNSFLPGNFGTIDFSSRSRQPIIE